MWHFICCVIVRRTSWKAKKKFVTQNKRFFINIVEVYLCHGAVGVSFVLHFHSLTLHRRVLKCCEMPSVNYYYYTSRTVGGKYINCALGFIVSRTLNCRDFEIISYTIYITRITAFSNLLLITWLWVFLILWISTEWWQTNRKLWLIIFNHISSYLKVFLKQHKIIKLREINFNVLRLSVQETLSRRFVGWTFI